MHQSILRREINKQFCKFEPTKLFSSSFSFSSSSLSCNLVPSAYIVYTNPGASIFANKQGRRHFSSNRNNNKSSSSSSSSTFDNMFTKPSLYDLSLHEDVDSQTIYWQYYQSLYSVKSNITPLTAENGLLQSEQIDWDYCVTCSQTYISEWMKSSKGGRDLNISIKQPHSTAASTTIVVTTGTQNDTIDENSTNNNNNTLSNINSSDIEVQQQYHHQNRNNNGITTPATNITTKTIINREVQLQENDVSKRNNDDGEIYESNFHQGDVVVDRVVRTNEMTIVDNSNSRKSVVVNSTQRKLNERSLDDVIKEALRAKLYFEAVYVKTYEKEELSAKRSEGKEQYQVLNDQHPDITYDHLVAWYSITPQAATQVLFNFNRYAYALERWIINDKTKVEKTSSNLETCLSIASGLLGSLEVISKLPTTQGEKMQENLMLLVDRLKNVENELKTIQDFKKPEKKASQKTRSKKTVMATQTPQRNRR